MVEVVYSIVANVISEYAKRVAEKVSQGKRITAPSSWS